MRMSITCMMEFDRSDRTYRGGEPVVGRLIIDTDAGERCRSVTLAQYSRAHGQGNPDRGPNLSSVILHRGPLQGHPPFTLPFDLPAPNSPFSYQGELFSVDHYLEANVDFAGAMDDLVTQRYTVVPGALVGPPHSRLMAVTRRSMGQPPKGWRLGLGIAAIFVGLATLPYGIAFILLGLILLVPPAKRVLAEGRLGSVTAYLGNRVVAPGDPLEVKLQIKPKSSSTINSASVEIRARERCVWKSGDQRKVHRKVVYSHETPISGATNLDQTTIRTFTAPVPIPETAGHTFLSTDNQLTWEAVVRVDIPNWPDWEKTFPIVVWPAPGQVGPPKVSLPTEAEELDADLGQWLEERQPEDLNAGVGHDSEAAIYGGLSLGATEHEAISEDPQVRVAESQAASEVQIAAREDPEQEPSAPRADEPEKPVPPAPAPTAPGIQEAVEAIIAERVIGGTRDRLIAELLGSTFQFDLAVKRVERTFAMYSDPDLRNGRTVVGIIPGTDLEVSVWFPEGRNDEVDAFERGATYTILGTVAEWDRLRLGPRIRAAD